MTMISIINYGVGNLQNICNAFNYLQKKSQVISTPKELAKAEKIILPGVGSFGYCVQKIKEYNYTDALLEAVTKKIPLLGICVGMQVLFEKSIELGEHRGLGVLGGKVERLETKYKVPQIGWNQVSNCQDNQKQWFYFVHSYHVIPKETSIVVGKCNYGIPVVSIIKKENIWGTQFHPEKSQDAGLSFLNQFANY